jgi:hypothetical protein
MSSMTQHETICVMNQKVFREAYLVGNQSAITATGRSVDEAAQNLVNLLKVRYEYNFTLPIWVQELTPEGGIRNEGWLGTI